MSAESLRAKLFCGAFAGLVFISRGAFFARSDYGGYAMRKLVSVRIALFAALFAAQAACGVFAAQENRAGENPGGGERQKKVAVYARNDSGDKALDSKVRTFELAVAARLNNMGFGVIDRGIAAESLDAYLSPARAGGGAERSSAAGNAAEDSPGTRLFKGASGLRVAELVGADYVLVVGFSGFGSERKSYRGYGIETSGETFALRADYALSGGTDAAGISGGAVRATKTLSRIPGLSVDSNDVLNELVENLADEVARSLSERVKPAELPSKAAARGEVEIVCTLDELSMPEVVFEGGKYVLKPNLIPATVPYINAEIDGVAQTVGGRVSLARGLHILRVKQADIEPFEANIFVTGAPNQILRFALKLSDSARARWKEDLEFLERVKRLALEASDASVLTRAQAERLMGIAEMYKNSGYNIRIDAKNLPEIRKSQSLFGQ